MHTCIHTHTHIPMALGAPLVCPRAEIRCHSWPICQVLTGQCSWVSPSSDRPMLLVGSRHCQAIAPGLGQTPDGPLKWLQVLPSTTMGLPSPQSILCPHPLGMGMKTNASDPGIPAASAFPGPAAGLPSIWCGSPNGVNSRGLRANRQTPVLLYGQAWWGWG